MLYMISLLRIFFNLISSSIVNLQKEVCHNLQRSILINFGHVCWLVYETSSPEARLDIKAGSFWSLGETAFFDVLVTHVNSTCNQNKSTESIFVEREKEKKRKHQQRVIDVEMGSPLLPPGFWHKLMNGERMQTFPEQPSEQTFPKERRV